MSMSGDRGTRRRMAVFAVCGALFARAVRADAPPSAAEVDSVLWSDGRTWSGRIALGGDARLPLHDGTTLRPLPLARIARIAWHVATQRLERAWTFVEAGRTAKRFTGEPYPVRHWEAVVTLVNGDTVRGQIVATVFYLEDAAGVSRLVVRSKQRGRAGEDFAALVGPVEIRFARDPDADDLSWGRAVRIGVEGAPAGLALAVATLDPTRTADVRPTGTGRFAVLAHGTRPIPALRHDRAVRVGWPAAADAFPDLRTRLEAALPHVRDFFDRRHVVAAMPDVAESGRGHSLMLLAREGRTTLDDPRPLPWHVEIWTWRWGDGTAILFEGRAVLFRDRRAAVDPLPDIEVRPELAPRGAWDASETLRWE